VNRSTALQQLADSTATWDVLVIGGGATGLGVAVDSAARGYRTALITNSVVEWLPWWDRVLPDGDVFDVVVHSCRVGLRKPDPAIYRLALDRLGVQPAEAMFLDDFEAMADAAREVGMHVVHVTEHAAALRDARALLDQHV